MRRHFPWRSFRPTQILSARLIIIVHLPSIIPFFHRQPFRAMAERALYQNFSEPELPFEKMRDRLEWLPSYCDSITHKTDGTVDKHVFNVMINTILVCSRARTSTILDCTSTCRQS